LGFQGIETMLDFIERYLRIFPDGGDGFDRSSAGRSANFGDYFARVASGRKNKQSAINKSRALGSA